MGSSAIGATTRTTANMARAGTEIEVIEIGTESRIVAGTSVTAMTSGIETGTGTGTDETRTDESVGTVATIALAETVGGRARVAVAPRPRRLTCSAAHLVYM